MIHSYSSISCFESCPWQFRDRYVLKNKYPDTPQQAAGTAAHLALQRRLEDRRALPPELANAEPLIQSLEKRGRPIAERKLAMTRDFQPTDFFADDAWLRGVLDVILYGHGTGVIADWKTGKVREGDGLQLEICAALLFVNFPMVERIAAFNVWLRTGRPGGPWRWSRDELPEMLARVVALTDRIEADTEFKAKPSPLCGWCRTPDCKERRGNAPTP